MVHRFGLLVALFWLLLLPSTHAPAFELDLRGSLGEQGHARYVPPLSNPLFNETPYITTEIRPIYLHNKIPNNFITQGGKIDLVAAEVRVALNKRLGIIASKDGYARIRFDEVLDNESGFANASIGVKYALHSDPQTESIVSAGIEYEVPSGNLRTNGIHLQGNGKGFLNLFVTGATAVDKLGLQASAGINQALERDANSSLLHASVHVDYEVLPGLYPLAELNFFSFYHPGDELAVDFEGIDLVNLGATDPGDVTTVAAGARYRFNRHVQLGMGYEEPIGSREDIMDWRFYLDFVITY